MSLIVSRLICFVSLQNDARFLALQRVLVSVDEPSGYSGRGSGLKRGRSDFDEILFSGLLRYRLTCEAGRDVKEESRPFLVLAGQTFRCHSQKDIHECWNRISNHRRRGWGWRGSGQEAARAVSHSLGYAAYPGRGLLLATERLGLILRVSFFSRSWFELREKEMNWGGKIGIVFNTNLGGKFVVIHFRK